LLEVDVAFVPDTPWRHNPAGVPESKAAHAAIKVMATGAKISKRTFLPRSRIASSIFPFLSRSRQAVQARGLTKPPPIDPEIRAELIEGYTDDIQKPQELIGRDLSRWLR
jgi:hypothetical protein